MVAIKWTQTDPGLKLCPKFLGRYRMTRILRNDPYVVQKKLVSTKGDLYSSGSPETLG